MKRLIICEKANAAKRISYILSEGKVATSRGRTRMYTFEYDGKETVCMGLRGHIVEIDYGKEYNDWGKVPLKKLVNAEPVTMVREKGIVSLLRSVSKDHDDVIVATDYDREGEIIGVEALEAMGVEPASARRARFSALTYPEVKGAFENLDSVDLNLANSARSRQYIDLAWGSVLTRFLSITGGRRGKDFLSAGRVQSPTLALIVERHLERENFVPEPYWDVTVTLEHDGKAFATEHEDNHFKDEEKAKAAVERLKKHRTATVTGFSSEEKKNYAPPPFDTTMFIREAAKLGLGAKKAMDVAEELYMKGKISYPRTDNTVYPRGTQFRKILANLKKGEFRELAEKIDAQETIRPRRGRKTATDHPPIHPVDHATRKGLSPDEWKVYELVVRRFLATLSPPATVEERNIELEAGEDRLKGHGVKVVAPGWMEFYPYIETKEAWVPRVAPGGELPIKRRASTGKKTKPPQAFNQGSIIVEMEKKGLGTKSTRHETIDKLQRRGFIHKGRNIEPTVSGIAVVTALKDGAPIIIDPKMTAELEEEMMEIASGRKSYEEVIADSREKLERVVEELEKHRDIISKDLREALRGQHHVGACPECGKPLVVRRSRRGGSFVGCSGYPDCKVTYPLPNGEKVEVTGKTCAACGKPTLKVSGTRGNKGELCIDPDCESNRALDVLGTCKECGNEIRIRTGRTGKRFAGCSGYPDCKVTFPLPQKGKIEPCEEVCPKCGLPRIRVITKGKKPWLKCIDMNCDKG